MKIFSSKRERTHIFFSFLFVKKIEIYIFVFQEGKLKKTLSVRKKLEKSLKTEHLVQQLYQNLDMLKF